MRTLLALSLMLTASLFTPQALALCDLKHGICVDISEQRACFMRNGSAVRCDQVSTARPGKYTPHGTYHVQSRQRHKRSNRYNNAPMPYSLQFTGHYFIHQGPLPPPRTKEGISAGCVRTTREFARYLWDNAPIGTPIHIQN